MGVRMKNRHDRDTANRSPDIDHVALEGVQGNPLELVAGVCTDVGAAMSATRSGGRIEYRIRTS